MPDNIKRDRSYPACGRLIVLQSKGDRPLFDNNTDENFVGFTAINFPAMPDTIELTRRADYMISTNPAFPDGIHQYRGTSPLEIPISFKLHAFDREYCPKGVRTLLQSAADLHALTLPFGPNTIPVVVGPSDEGTDAAKSKKASTDFTLQGQVDTKDIFPPPTCYLELIVTERNSPGIACVGYVKEASIKLGGPYLKGPGISQLLPTTGEFSFTFVHHPGHSNGYNLDRRDLSTEQQAFAEKVKDRLYNTRDLLTRVDFKAFNSTVGNTSG